MNERTYKLYPARKSSIKTFDAIEKPCLYSPSKYGLTDCGEGEGVSIAIIDSGKPSHRDIKNIAESVNLSDVSKNVDDKLGHSTMVAGVIGASNESQVYGIAPKASLYFPKVVNASGICSYDALLAAMLWCIVKDVDVALISLASDVDYTVLYDAIKKAHSHGITIIASAGDGKTKYPASYKEVISVGREGDDTDAQLKISDRGMRTTYLHNKYARATGTSLTAALGAGLAALIVEKNRKAGRSTSPKAIYKDMSRLH